MTTNPTPSPAAQPAGRSPAEDARDLVRGCLKGALATLSRSTGDPYASLVTVATSFEGCPLFLISKLALHTQNLIANPRASLLVDGTDNTGDPLAGGRVTLTGHAEITTDAGERRRFLARQPAAQGYSTFPDFAFYKLHVESAHFIGGFGRIVSLTAADMLLGAQDAKNLREAEPDIVAHMNEDHAGALELFASRLAGKSPGPWRMTAIDSEGFDIVCDDQTARIRFAHNLNSAGDARKEFVRLAALARS